MQQNNVIPKWLGYLGLIPFIVSSVLAWIPELNQIALQSLTIYAAVIITFIGGVHWGQAMQITTQTNEPYIRNQFIFSIAPSLVAWFAVVFVQPYALLIMAGCFVLFWYIEKTIFNKTLHNWYARLRNHLTLVATTFIIIGWLSTL